LGFFDCVSFFYSLSPPDLKVSSLISIYESFFFFPIFLFSEAISLPFFFVFVFVLLIELITEEHTLPAPLPPPFFGYPSSYYEFKRRRPLNYFFINLINEESA
jgi:hypothetical protein